MSFRFFLRIFLILACASRPAHAAEAPAVLPVPSDHAQQMARGLDLFKEKVGPVLQERCVKCHGGEKTKGQFDLTSRESLLRGGGDGPAIVVGQAKTSSLYKLITHAEEPHMPSKAPKLSDEAIGQIAAWIDAGAPYDKPLIEKSPGAKGKPTVTDQDRRFWSFQSLKTSVPPKLKNQSWCRTPIDHFIMTKLEEKNLKPNQPLDRRNLIRRVYFDLIGLPPTPEEVDAFVNNRSRDAYENLIDQLLASPHYGERWGRHWLDVSRFAESHGFEHDYDRPYAYHFRDFVIKALNRDMPYDQFVQWQLAGDEMAPDDPLALMATGFLGAGVFPTQITANEVERTRYDALDDMVATLGTAMLGLTVGCARCHDHKYDPIPTHDYYRLISTFTTTVRSEIELDLNPEVYRQEKRIFDTAHAPFEKALQAYQEKEFPKQFEQWLAGRSQEPEMPAWILLELDSSKASGGAKFQKLEDGSYLVTGDNPDFDTYTLVTHTEQKGITAIRLEALADESLATNGPGRSDNGNIGLGRIRLTVAPGQGGGPTNEVKLTNPKATFEQNRTNLSIAAALDADKKTGWAVDPQLGRNHAAVFETEEAIGFDGGTILTFTLEFTVNKKHNIGRPRLSFTTAPTPPSLEGNVQPPKVAHLLERLKDGSNLAGLNAGEKTSLMAWYRTIDPGWRVLNAKLQAHLRKAPKPNLTKVMVCSEGFKPLRHHTQGVDFFNETYFLNRGSTDQKKEVVAPGFLQVLMKGPEKQWLAEPPKGWRTSYRRTGLAHWITDTQAGAGNLLARVMVNRLWQHHLGEGIVATPNDFGAQGQRPTHPELLDWLAGQLIENGWHLKPMHKLIMTSAVYLQDSQVDSQKTKLDPNNQFYSRRSPKRLEAEIIRDSLLAVSGGLDDRMYGPGTLDPKSNRRSIYFMIKRSQLIPMMQLLDAPEPLVSAGNRPSTTIAPQALMFMNNASVRSCSLQFAKRLSATAAQRSLADALNQGYLIALGRQPDKTELADSISFVRQQMESYRADEKPAGQELALADFCQVLMSLNEFIYIE